MNNKTLRMIFTLNDFEKDMLHKSLVNIPKYLSLTNNITAEVVYLHDNFEFKDTGRLKFRRFRSYLLPFFKKNIMNRNFMMILYLLKVARHTDILMLLHLTNVSAMFGFIYKFLNPKGKLYIKLDMDQNFFEYIPSHTSKTIIQRFLKISDLISIESQEMYNILISKDNLYGTCIKDKLIKIPNAFDDIYFKEQNIRIKEFHEKENIILTVGRLGTNQKNTELFLDILKTVNLKDWKVLLVGTIEKNFSDQIENFYIENPHLKERVTFLGSIANKQELFELYNKCRIFCLTSRFEGFATVFVEAIYFGNTVVTTNVNGAIEATDNNKLGYITNNCAQEFTEKLEYLINHQEILENNYLKLIPYARKKFTWSSVIKNDKFIELLGLKDE